MSYFENFGMMIPKEPFKPLQKMRVPRWKRLLCFVFGHKWRTLMVTTLDDTLPDICVRCTKTRWLKKTDLRKTIPLFIKNTLDKILRPLCYIGLHRWKSTFSYSSYQYWAARRSAIITENNYSCSRCKKNKTISIKH